MEISDIRDLDISILFVGVDVGRLFRPFENVIMISDVDMSERRSMLSFQKTDFGRVEIYGIRSVDSTGRASGRKNGFAITIKNDCHVDGWDDDMKSCDEARIRGPLPAGFEPKGLVRYGAFSVIETADISYLFSSEDLSPVMKRLVSP